MTFEQAIEFAINIAGKPSSDREIADAINALGIYKREDEKPLEPNHISARVANHPTIFSISHNGLIGIKKETKTLYQRLVSQLQDILRNVETSRKIDVLIPTYIFLERIRYIYPDALFSFRNDSFSIKFDARIKQLNQPYETGYEITSIDEDLISGLMASLPHILERKINDLLKSYDFSLQACSNEDFGSFFNSLLGSSSLSHGALGDFATPLSVSKVIADLATIKSNERVFDPFGGNAGLFCDLNRNQKKDAYFFLNDIDKYCVLLGKMNLILNGVKHFHYTCQNSIEEYLQPVNQGELFDWVITHPPFGVRLPKEVTKASTISLFGYNSKPELLFIDLILKRLKNNGKAIIIVPESFLFIEDKAYVNARRILVNNGWLEKVVSLPAGAFLPYTSAKASILFIEKKERKDLDSDVQFIELSEQDLKEDFANKVFSIEHIIKSKPRQSVLVSPKILEKERYSLSVNRFLNQEYTSFGPEYIQLGNLVKDYFSGSNYNQKYLNSNEGIPYLNIKDLSDEKRFFKLNPEKVNTFISPLFYEGNSTKKQPPKGSVLLAKIGNKLKPTLNISKVQVAVSGNILVLVPDTDKISPTYLISQFHEKYVLKQVDRIRGGAVQPFVRIDDLLNLYIKVPPQTQQREIEDEFTLNQLENIPSRDFTELTNSKEDIDLPSAINHEYKNLKNPLSSNISNLKNFLDQKIRNKEFVSWDDKIAANAGARSIQTVFADISELMNEMSSLIDDVVTVVNLNKEGSRINRQSVLAFTYFEKTAKKVEAEFPEIQLEFRFTDKKVFSNILLEIDDKLFSKVIRNFVANSLKHGYEDSIGKKPVYIFISTSEDSLTFQIDLLNDGKPFEEGFTFNDFISFGKRAGKNKGSGIGGFIMNQIILHHNGTLEMLEIEKGDSLRGRINAILKTGVHFRIKLPIIK